MRKKKAGTSGAVSGIRVLISTVNRELVGGGPPHFHSPPRFRGRVGIDVGIDRSDRDGKKFWRHLRSIADRGRSDLNAQLTVTIRKRTATAATTTVRTTITVGTTTDRGTAVTFAIRTSTARTTI